MPTDQSVNIQHKIDESDKTNSFIHVVGDSGAEVKLSVDLLNKIYSVMREVDPFSFAFEAGDEGGQD